MKIGLVFAPYTHKKFEENITIVDDEFGVFPPINLAYAAAVLEKAGHEVILVDANARNLKNKQIVDEIEAFSPDIIGAYFSTYMFHMTLDTMTEVKKRVNVPLIAGGINLLLYPKESLTHKVIDYGLSGESNINFPMLLERLENGKKVDDIPGLTFRNEGGEIISNPPSTNVTPFDDYPLPARHLLPNHLYYSFISQLKDFTVQMTALGCPFKCTFCAIAKIPYRFRSPENIAEENAIAQKDFNINEFDIFDADFPVQKKRTLRIIEQWRKRNLKFEWSCRSRVDSLDEELISEMALSGCRQVYLGVETADEHALKEMRKGINVSQTAKAISLCKKYDIRPLGFFMVGNPGETRKTIKRTIKYAKNLKLDFAQFSRLIAKPQTDLDLQLIETTGKDFWQNWVLGTQPEERMPNPWTNLSEQEIEDLTKKAYYSFYFRPWMVVKHILRVRSFSELIRFIKVGLQMAFSYFYRDTDQ